MSVASAGAAEDLLRAENVHAELGGTEVLRGVDLRVGEGEVLGVLGPSGAGKTTLFRALVGDLKTTAGRVWLCGGDVSQAPLWARAQRGLGYVPQTPSVLLDLTVADNFRTFQTVVGRASESVVELADRGGLADRLRVRAGELSGGERRKLEVLRALVGSPRVLVCDEPFAGVDPVASAAIGRLLREHARSGHGVILADHRVGEALQVCDFTHLLVDGSIELSVAPGEFAAHPAVRRRYLG